MFPVNSEVIEILPEIPVIRSFSDNPVGSLARLSLKLPSSHTDLLSPMTWSHSYDSIVMKYFLVIPLPSRPQNSLTNLKIGS